MKIYYYKIVSKYPGSEIDEFLWFSAFIKNCNAVVVYPINKWAYPVLKNTKLFVYDTLINAQYSLGIGDAIFKCRVKKPKKQRFIYSSYQNELFVTENILDFWEKDIKAMGPRSFAPIGTITCNAVKILEEIK